MKQSVRKIQSINHSANSVVASVFSSDRKLKSPRIKLPKGMAFNARLKLDGLNFLSQLPKDSIPVAFFDPQYRGVLDKLSYGNEGQKRGKARYLLPQMEEKTIGQFIQAIDRVLMPSGHLFLWMDKFHLCNGFLHWLNETFLDLVDMLTWYKKKMGMGYRTRRMSEHLVILQKQPRRAKGVWTIHNIPDVWEEEVKRNGHAHKKPVKLQGELMSAVSHSGDIIIDPAAGSFSVMESCQLRNRNFLGCDING